MKKQNDRYADWWYNIRKGFRFSTPWDTGRRVALENVIEKIYVYKKESGEMDMVYVLVVMGIFLGDLWIKDYVEREFPEQGERVKLKGFLRLRRHYNRGAFLDMGQRKRRAVAVLSVCLTLIVAVLFVLTLGTKGNVPLKTGLAMLLGGAFSNTYDRLKRKYVVDYFSLGVRWKWLSCIIFNISDFGIIVGALVAVLSVG